MSKQTGFGHNLYISGYDVSADIQSLEGLSASLALIDQTNITQSAFERVAGRADGALNAVSYFNPDAGAIHGLLGALPTTDAVVTYAVGTDLGDTAACMVAKQADYPGARTADGGFTFKPAFVANGFGLEWGIQLTAGLRTDTAATNGTGVDLTTVSTDFGAQAYLQVTDVQGTDVTVTIQDSADNINFSACGLAFTALAEASDHTAQRIMTASSTENIRRYVRAITTTAAGFTSATFSVVIVRNNIARQF